MKFLVLSLEEYAYDWFHDLEDYKFKTIQGLIHSFSERWGDRNEYFHWLDSLDSFKKEENETMNEFNKCFNDFIHDLPDAIRPPNDVILIYYMGAFNDEIYYQLRDK